MFRPSGVLQACVLLVLLALISLASATPAAPAPQPAAPRLIEITARRFAFEPAEIDVAVGEPVRLLVKSADGVHGVEIKRFRVSREIPRGGDVVAIEFTPDTAGRFPILCSEYCGRNHADMKGVLVVRARDGSSP